MLYKRDFKFLVIVFAFENHSVGMTGLSHFKYIFTRNTKKFLPENDIDKGEGRLVNALN